MARTRQIFALAMALVITLISTSPVRAQEVGWRNDYEAAQREAQATGRPMFLDFGTHSCIWCQKLDATFHAPAVMNLLNQYFIPVRIDADRERELTNRMGIHSFPTLVILDPSGKLIDRREGFLEAGPMSGFLEQAKRVASSAPRQQFRAQAREDRIPARVLAIEEPVRRPQPPVAAEQVASRPESLHLPSPEELGLVSEKPALASEIRPIDWTAVHTKLDRLGASSFVVQRAGAQLIRIVGMFPTAENRVHRVEASASTETEAVRLFLEQVDEWAAHP